MLRTLRKNFTYTNIAMTAVLVLAMSGGAYAANKYLITSTKQISPKVLKSLAAKAGARGLPGAAGPQGKEGAVGKEGSVGKEGPAGKEGPVGKEGTNGTSAQVASFNGIKGTCAAGGVEVKSASPTVSVCNGKEGSPWTDKGTLPKGASERGQWAISGFHEVGEIFASISFPIPLATPLGEHEVHFIGFEEGSQEAHEAAAVANGECTGNWKEPGASSGRLCVFYSPGFSTPPSLSIVDAETDEPGAGVSGAVLGELSVKEEQVQFEGSWVMTG